MKTSKQRREQRKRQRERMLNKSKPCAGPLLNNCVNNPFACPSNSHPVEIIYQQMIAATRTSNSLNYLATLPVCIQDQEQQENTMNTNTIPAEKTYLVNRLDASNYKVLNAILPTKFGLTDDERPRTANELVARITAGTYIVSKDGGDSRAYDPMDYIRWRDPKVVEDKVGYAAAEKVLKLAYTAAKDQIIVKDIDTGLTALQAFETANLPAN